MTRPTIGLVSALIVVVMGLGPPPVRHGPPGAQAPRAPEAAPGPRIAAPGPHVSEAACGPISLPADPVPVTSTDELHTAIDELDDGQTVVVQPGRYELNRTLRIRGGVSDVRLAGATGDPADVILAGPGMTAPGGALPHGVLVEDASQVTIDGLTLTGYPFHGIQIQGERGAREIRLHRLAILDTGEQLIKASSGGPPGPYADDVEVSCSRLAYTDEPPSWYTNAVDVLAGARWTIRDNLIERIRRSSGPTAGPAILMWRNSTDTVVERNVIVDSERGIALGLSSPDPAYARDGETRYDHQRGVVRNNVFVRRPGVSGDVGITVNYARDFVVAHNTVLVNGTFQAAIDYRFPSSTGVIVNNLTDGAIWQRDGATAEVGGNVTDAALDWFVDALRLDLHLSGRVPGVVDVATPGAVEDDLDGHRRPVGNGPDVGADEWGSEAPQRLHLPWLYLPWTEVSARAPRSRVLAKSIYKVVPGLPDV